MKPAAVQLSLIGLALVLAIGNLVQLSSNRKLREQVATLQASAPGKDELAANPLGSAAGGANNRRAGTGAAADGGNKKLVAMTPKDKQEGETFSSIAEKYAKSVENNPAIQKQMLAQFEAQLGNVLEDLYTELGLEGEELVQFKGLIAEHWRVQAQVPMQLMSAMDDPEKVAKIKENLKASKEATDANIKEFLNDEADYAYFETYRDQIPDRMEVDQYRDAMESAGQELTPDQAAQLITAMAEERKTSGLGDVNDPMQWDMEEFNEDTVKEVMGQMSDFHSRVQVRAGSILDQEQVSVLAESQDDIRQQQELGMRFGLQMMEAMRSKEQPGTPASPAGDARSSDGPE